MCAMDDVCDKSCIARPATPRKTRDETDSSSFTTLHETERQ